jgi:hypothetical protein
VPQARDPRDVIVAKQAADLTDLSVGDQMLVANLSASCGDVDFDPQTQLPRKLGLFYGWGLIQEGAQGRAVINLMITKGLTGAQVKAACAGWVPVTRRGGRQTKTVADVLAAVNATVAGASVVGQ